MAFKSPTEGASDIVPPSDPKKPIFGFEHKQRNLSDGSDGQRRLSDGSDGARRLSGGDDVSLPQEQDAVLRSPQARFRTQGSSFAQQKFRDTDPKPVPAQPETFEQKMIREFDQKNTSMTEQFIETAVKMPIQLATGFIAAAFPELDIQDTEEASNDALRFFTDQKRLVPYENLTPSQKTAAFSGTAIGTLAPGVGIYKGIGTGGAVAKVGLERIGRDKLIKESQKFAVRQVKDIPAKTVLGKMSRQIVKNGPALAVEGAAWEGLLSGGDPQRMVEGAVIFPVAGASLSVAGNRVTSYVRTVGPQVARETFRRAGLAKEQIDELIDFSIVISKSERGAIGRDIKQTGIDGVVKEKATKLTPSQAKAKEMKERALLALENTNRMLNEADLDRIAAKHTTTLLALQKRIDRVANKRNLVAEDINKLFEARGKEMPFSMRRIPKTFDELNVSDHARRSMEEHFPNGPVSLLDDWSKSQTPLEDFIAAVNKDLNSQQLSKITDELLIPKVLVSKGRFAPVSKLNNELNKLKAQKAKVLAAKEAATRHSSYKRKRGFIELRPDGQKIFKEEFARLMREANLILDEPLEKFFDPFRRGLAIGNRIERITGLPYNQILMDMIEYTNKKHKMLIDFDEKYLPKQLMNDLKKEYKTLGLSDDQIGEEITKLWFYMEKQANGKIRFNPNPRTKQFEEGANYLLRPQFDGVTPSEKILDMMTKVVESTNELRELNVIAGHTVGNFMNYVPKQVNGRYMYQSYDDFFVRPAGFTGKRSNIGTQIGQTADDIEKDFFKLYPRMVRRQINNAAMGPENMERINSTLLQLDALGMKESSEILRKRIMKGLGYVKRDKFFEDMVENSVEQTKPFMELALSKMPGITDDNLPMFREDLKRAVYNITYEATIGMSAINPDLNRNILTAQILQPQLVGAAEVGFGNITRAEFIVQSLRKLKIGKTRFKEDFDALNRVEARLIPERVDPELMGEVQRVWLKRLAWVLGSPGKPGMKLFNIRDANNRRVSFVAGRRFAKQNFKNGKFDQRAFETFTESETTRVLETLQLKGEQAALDQYGLIAARRHNYAYSIIDRPSAMLDGPMSGIPFLTWGGNQIEIQARLVRKALQEKGVKSKLPLIYSYAYPLAMIGVGQMMFNQRWYPEKVPVGPVNVEVSKRLPQMSVLPAFTDSVLDIFAVPKIIGNVFTSAKQNPFSKSVIRYEELRDEGMVDVLLGTKNTGQEDPRTKLLFPRITVRKKESKSQKRRLGGGAKKRKLSGGLKKRQLSN